MTLTVNRTRVYDDFTGLGLDPGRWRSLEYPSQGRYGPWRCEEPNGRTDVGEGTLDMHVEEFERAHDQVQLFDNSKHHLLSTEVFAVPKAGRLTFSLEMAATSINGTFNDYRDGFASFRLLDIPSCWSFQIGVTSDRIFAIYTCLASGPARRHVTNIIDLPIGGIPVRPGLGHFYEVTLDSMRQVLEWRVDHQQVFAPGGTPLPSRVCVGLGMTTLHQISAGRSRSVRGQGMSASYGRIEVDSC